MLEKNVYFIPEKVIKIHSMVQQHKHNLPTKQHNSTCNEQIIYYASRCLEVKKIQNLLSQTCYNDI
jgi:hypothetical protein